MVITDSGRSRQIDLTPGRVRIGIVGALCLLVLVAAGGLMAGSYWAASGSPDSERADLLDRVKVLEEQLQSKELELAVQKKRLEALKQAGTPATDDSPAAGEPAPESESALSQAPPSSDERLAAAQPETPPRHSEPWGTAGSSGPSDTAPLFQPPRPDVPSATEPVRESDRVAALPRASQPPVEQPLVMNFNAEDLVATAKAPDAGTISFRLTKDRPDTRFNGYLFVYLEVRGRSGEQYIYVHPSGTNLGEGDLPTDYRQGKPIRFQRYSQVALDYDREYERRGAELAGISILLYDESGRIVFQRGFERAEISSGGKGSHDVGVSPTESQRRGRAL